MKGLRKGATKRANSGEAPGFAVRRLAAEILDGVLRRHRALDDLLDSTGDLGTLAERDRALVRVLVTTVLRRLGTLRHLIKAFLDRGAPVQAPRVETALLEANCRGRQSQWWIAFKVSLGSSSATALFKYRALESNCRDFDFKCAALFSLQQFFPTTR